MILPRLGGRFECRDAAHLSLRSRFFGRACRERFFLCLVTYFCSRGSAAGTSVILKALGCCLLLRSFLGLAPSCPVVAAVASSIVPVAEPSDALCWRAVASPRPLRAAPVRRLPAQYALGGAPRGGGVCRGLAVRCGSIRWMDASGMVG